MKDERQGLRANAASNIDNQRAIRKIFPGVPCRSCNSSQTAVCKASLGTEPLRTVSADVMFLKPFIAAPNLAGRYLLSGLSYQLHKSPSIIECLVQSCLVRFMGMSEIRVEDRPSQIGRALETFVEAVGRYQDRGKRVRWTNHTHVR